MSTWIWVRTIVIFLPRLIAFDCRKLVLVDLDLGRNKLVILLPRLDLLLIIRNLYLSILIRVETIVMFIPRLIAFDRRKLVLVDLDLGENNSDFSSKADCF